MKSDMGRARAVKVAALALIAGAAGCVAATSDSVEHAPAEATLCELSIGEATVDDAREILGDEWTSTSVAEFTRLTYQYGEAPGAVFMFLTFDEQGVLSDAVMMGAPFPDCWKDDVARIEREENL